jgi:signal recognition particle receptor subunit beta
MLINFAQREAQVKIVYYGPPLAGKTTSLQYLASRVEVDVSELPTQEDRTIFFEYAPLKQTMGKWNIRFHFYTLPGQQMYSLTRRLILNGVDGIVYVADSQYSAAEENLRMLADLLDNLGAYGKGVEGLSHMVELLPIVLFYNKRDLDGVMPVPYMDATFNLQKWKARRIVGCALSGNNVVQAADMLSSYLMSQLSARLGLEPGDEDPERAVQ